MKRSSAWWRSLLLRRGPGRFRRDRRGVTLVEMAIIMPIFLVFLFMLFEVAFDQLMQGELESALHYTAYQMQVGNTENTTFGPNSQTFVDQEFCPNAIAHLLVCGSLYVRVQRFDPNACTDFYPAMAGTAPVSGNMLELGDYSGDQPIPITNNAAVGPTSCELNSITGPQGIGFCNPLPNEYIIVTAVYVSPSIIAGLLPGQAYSYNGSLVHPAFATTAFYTEAYTAASTVPLQC